MSHLQQAAPIEALPENNAFQVLHVAPSAPQELIVEVYWRLVHQIQAAAQGDAGLRSRLDQLNEAYAAIVDPSVPARDEADLDPFSERVDGNQAATTWLGRLWKRPATRSSAKRSPWRLLHLAPSAPPDIVELAYSFWRIRLRSQWGDFAAPKLEKLQEAYEALRHSESDLPSESGLVISAAGAGANGVVAEAAPGVAAEAAPSATPDADPTTDAVAVDEPGAASISHPSLARAWRPVAAMSASFGRWAAGVASAAWERRPSLSEDRAAESQQRFPAGAPGPAGMDMNAPQDLAEAAPHPSVEERLAALTTSSVEPPDPEPAESEVSTESATEARADEGKPDGASAQPPTEPKVIPPLPSETALPLQPSQVVQPSEALAHLVAESGSAREVGAAIGPGPFTIGTDPRCDLVVAAGNADRINVAARIWAHEDRFMLHVMATAPAMLVNGQAVAWAVLEDGDRLQIGDNVFRFQRIRRGDKGG